MLLQYIQLDTFHTWSFILKKGATCKKWPEYRGSFPVAIYVELCRKLTSSYILQLILQELSDCRLMVQSVITGRDGPGLAR